MMKDDLILLYNKKWNEAKKRYHSSRKKYHETTDPELKEHYAVEREYYSTRQHLIAEFLNDLIGVTT